MASSIRLTDLGWRHFFNQQLDIDEIGVLRPVRVIAVHRNELRVIGEKFEEGIQPQFGESDEDKATIGDWLLLDPETHRVKRRLDRLSIFKRKAPGSSRSVQLIAANVDTLIIVSSCNQDYNTARLERYLALAKEADVTPIVVLTKADQLEAPEEYRRKAEKLLPQLYAITLNATDPSEVELLKQWCGTGQTVAFVGSSGVGKSTLTNSLMGKTVEETQAIREDDSRGRHTTSHRALHRLPMGGWVLDTPGMRELQLTDVGDGISEVFSDIEEFAANCRFADCSHETEPGCAVITALESGDLEEDRLFRWRKLMAENARNSRSIAESRAKDKAFGKMIKDVLKDSNQKKGR